MIQARYDRGGMAAEKDIDRIVQQAFFADTKPGVMIEVGAARPDYLSIGASFRAQGWQVLSIEPNPEFCDLHRALGNDVVQCACSDEDRDGVDFFVVDSNQADYLGGNVSFESFSSLGIRDEFAADLEKTQVKTDVRTIQVNVRRLDTILAEHTPPYVGRPACRGRGRLGVERDARLRCGPVSATGRHPGEPVQVGGVSPHHAAVRLHAVEAAKAQRDLHPQKDVPRSVAWLAQGCGFAFVDVLRNHVGGDGV